MNMNGLGKRIFYAVFLCGVIYFMLSFSVATRQEQNLTLEREKQQEEGLNIWYSNENLTSYLSGAALEYEKTEGVEIRLNLVPSSEYLKQIAEKSVTDDAETPDLYIVREELLENAYALGITSENTSEVYNEKNFAKTALDAVSYHGKMIAYPLSFHTSCLVYRSDLIEKPASLEQIMNCDISQFADKGIERSIDLNTGNILSEYVFIGQYTDVGGATGDEEETLLIDENMFSQSLGFFQSLITNAGISPNAMEDAMIFGYAQGKNLSLVLSSDYISALESYTKEGNIPFALMDIPKLTETLQSCTGSYTDAVVVNGMSVKQETATEFAQFLTMDYADNLYESAQIYPAYYEAGKSADNFDVVYEIYKKSDTFPKLLKTEDFSLKVKEVFEKAASGYDAAVLTTVFAESLKHRIITQEIAQQEEETALQEEETVPQEEETAPQEEEAVSQEEETVPQEKENIKERIYRDKITLLRDTRQ